MNERSREFHLEEFRQLKGEISILLERVASLFKYGLLGSAGVYSWFLTHWVDNPAGKQPPDVLFCASLIPPILVFYFGWLAWATYRHVDKIGLYLKTLERLLGEEQIEKNVWGWEAYWRQDKPVLLPLLFYFYVFLLVGEIGVAVRVYWVLLMK